MRSKIATIALFATVFTQAFSQEDPNEKILCGGTERWSQKVLTDNLVNTINFTPIGTTIAYLVSIQTPSPDPNMPRQAGIEDKTYSVVCNITIKKAETDNDFHLVLSDGVHTIIGEIPDPACSAAASSAYVNDYIAARNFINAHIAAGNVYNVNIPPVVVYGVAFIDPPHGQTGAAPNNLELHPVLDVHFASQPTGLKENNIVLKASVYPNPAKGELTIQASSSAYKFKDCSFKIFNQMGSLVKTVNLPNYGFEMNHKVSIEEIPSGIYYFQLLNKESSIYEGKFVKE